MSRLLFATVLGNPAVALKHHGRGFGQGKQGLGEICQLRNSVNEELGPEKTTHVSESTPHSNSLGLKLTPSLVHFKGSSECEVGPLWCEPPWNHHLQKHKAFKSCSWSLNFMIKLITGSDFHLSQL